MFLRRLPRVVENEDRHEFVDVTPEPPADAPVPDPVGIPMAIEELPECLARAEPDERPRVEFPQPCGKHLRDRSESTVVRLVSDFKRQGGVSLPSRVTAYDSAVAADKAAAETLAAAVRLAAEAEAQMAATAEKIALARVKAARAAADRILVAATLTPAEVLEIVDREYDSG